MKQMHFFCNRDVSESWLYSSESIKCAYQIITVIITIIIIIIIYSNT